MGPMQGTVAIVTGASTGIGPASSASPAFLRTPRQTLQTEPVGRLGAPGEIADAVVWLCSERSTFVTGQTLAVGGGFVAR